jgi:hypothetical protein
MNIKIILCYGLIFASSSFLDAKKVKRADYRSSYWKSLIKEAEVLDKKTHKFHDLKRYWTKVARYARSPKQDMKEPLYRKVKRAGFTSNEINVLFAHTRSKPNFRKLLKSTKITVASARERKSFYAEVRKRREFPAKFILNPGGVLYCLNGFIWD